MKIFIIFIVVSIISILCFSQIEIGENQIDLYSENTTSIKNDVQRYQIHEFDLNSYQEILEKFAIDKNVGAIEDEIDLIEKAKMVWLEEYSYLKEHLLKTYEGERFAILYDEKESCWLVCCSGKEEYDLSTAFQMLVKTDGTVLAIWF